MKVQVSVHSVERLYAVYQCERDLEVEAVILDHVTALPIPHHTLFKGNIR